MKYFAEFNNLGERIAGYVADGMPYSEADIQEQFPNAEEISVEDQEKYVTGRYIRDKVTKRPVVKPPYVLTPEEQQAITQKQLTDAVQAHMDKTAQTKGYDNLLTAVTYADEPAIPKFQTEGIAFRAWRSAVWDYCYAQLAAVLGGERQVPTAEELIAELPVLELTS